MLLLDVVSTGLTQVCLLYSPSFIFSRPPSLPRRCRSKQPVSSRWLMQCRPISLSTANLAIFHLISASQSLLQTPSRSVPPLCNRHASQGPSHLIAPHFRYQTAISWPPIARARPSYSGACRHKPCRFARHLAPTKYRPTTPISWKITSTYPAITPKQFAACSIIATKFAFERRLCCL